LVIFICTKVEKGLILVKGKLNKVANVRAKLMFCAEQKVLRTLCSVYDLDNNNGTDVSREKCEPTGKFVRVSLQ